MSALAEKIHVVAKMAAQKTGAAVTFTLQSPGTYTATTDTYASPSSSTVTGTAERVTGDPERYKALELIESEAPTLEFVPDTYGDVPPQGATVSFGGVTWTVRDVQPVAPDGSAVSARVVVVR